MGAGAVIGKQIIIMFIILLLGAVCHLRGLITKEGTKSLSIVELNIVNPVLIFMSYQTDYQPALMKGLLWAFLLSAVSFALAIALSYVLVRKSEKYCVIQRFSVVYSNCGFMGIPLISNIYGSEGVLYLTAYVTLFNLLVWTHGYMMMKGQRDFSSLIKALRSPSVIAVFVGFLFYVFKVHLPEIPYRSLEYISSINTPMAMLIAGATVAQTNIFKALTKSIQIYKVCMVKLLIVPLVTLGVIMLIPAPSMVKMVVTIAAGCPVATTGTMFAITMDRHPQKCSEFFAVTTVLSGLTLPLVTALGDKLL